MTVVSMTIVRKTPKVLFTHTDVKCEQCFINNTSVVAFTPKLCTSGFFN